MFAGATSLGYWQNRETVALESKIIMYDILIKAQRKNPLISQFFNYF